MIARIILFLLAAAAIPGVLAAVVLFGLAFIPPLRRWLTGNRTASKRMAFGAVLLAFGIVYTVLPYMDARVSYATRVIYATHGNGYSMSTSNNVIVDEQRLATLKENKDALIIELWLLRMTPTGIYRPCYTSNLVVCTLLKDLYASDFGWPWWPFLLLLGACAGLIGRSLFYMLARELAINSKNHNKG